MLTLMRTKAAAVSLSKYTLYSLRHSFSVCNLMLAIKNPHAVSHSAQFTESTSVNQALPFVTDLCLPVESAIPNHSLRTLRCFHSQSNALSPIAD